MMMAAEEVERRVKIAESRLKEAEQSVAAERKEIQAQGRRRRNNSKPPPRSAKKSSLLCRKICANFTRASPSATTAPPWPKPATACRGAACAFCRIFFRNCARKPTKRFSVARVAASSIHPGTIPIANPAVGSQKHPRWPRQIPDAARPPTPVEKASSATLPLRPSRRLRRIAQTLTAALAAIPGRLPTA